MSKDGKDSGVEALSDLHNRVLARTSADLERLLSDPLAPGLYLVATPIGNLADVTLRALAVLARADVVYCEDTRHSGKLLQHFGIRAETRSFHEHNEDTERDRVLKGLAGGARIALISDAGTPLVSDPGFKLVRAAVADGHMVVAIPGASAVLTALTVSGLPTDSFYFAGFLPSRQSARRTRIESLRDVPGSLIFFEAPQRTAEALSDLAHVLGERPGAVTRELTKLHEEAARGTLPELARLFTNRELKGEVVLIVGPPMRSAAGEDEIVLRLQAALKTLRLKEAAAIVAETLEVPRSRVYDIGLKLKDKRSEGD